MILRAAITGCRPNWRRFNWACLGLAQFVPLFVLTPVAGWAADRFERRTVARLANVVDLGVAVALGLLTMYDMLNLPIMFLMAAFHGMARVFVGPAMSAIAPNLVPPESLPRAIALEFNRMAIGIGDRSGSGGFSLCRQPIVALLGCRRIAWSGQSRIDLHSAGPPARKSRTTPSRTPDDRGIALHMVGAVPARCDYA